MDTNGFQAAKSVYLNGMSGMKQILNMGEVKFGDRNSPTYKFFKKVVMDEIYDGMSKTFAEMEASGMVKRCPCGTSVRDGYKKCDMCSGAGFCNTDEFSKFFNE